MDGQRAPNDQKSFPLLEELCATAEGRERLDARWRPHFQASLLGEGCLSLDYRYNREGYYRIRLSDKPNGAGQHHVYAHRLFWILAHRRPIPQGLVLDHMCNFSSCVNPAHLNPITNAENVEKQHYIAAGNPAPVWEPIELPEWSMLGYNPPWLTVPAKPLTFERRILAVFGECAGGATGLAVPQAEREGFEAAILAHQGCCGTVPKWQAYRTPDAASP